MFAEPIDPVAVREAITEIANALASPSMQSGLQSFAGIEEGRPPIPATIVETKHLRLLLRALDEGREASAPFAVVVADYKKQTQVESDPDYPMLGRIGWEEDPRPPQVRWRELDRLAAWSEAVSEPEGKNT